MKTTFTETKLTILSIVFCIIVLCSINLFCKIPVSNTLLYYTSCFYVITYSLWNGWNYKYYTKAIYLFPSLYVCWALAEIARGFFIFESYWVFNQLLHGIFDILPLVVVFSFTNPKLFFRIFRPLNTFITILSLLLFGWCLPLENYAFLLVPFFYLYLCFFFKIPNNWKWITLFFCILIITQLENRSGVLKALASIGICFLFYFPNKIQNIALYIFHYLFYTAGIVFLWLGLSGTYNVFDSAYFDDDKQYIFKIENQDEVVEKSADTRTFIYIEVLTTAFDYDCLWVGRSPAHGYISPYFTAEGPIEAGRDPEERFASEVAHLNTFTWLGLTGLILLSLAYFQGTFLALHKSKNQYVKCISVAIAFHWLYGWVENINEFHLADLMIYIMLGICYSPQFRAMKNIEFELFFRSLFSSNDTISQYEKYIILKNKIKVQFIKRIIYKNKI